MNLHDLLDPLTVESLWFAESVLTYWVLPLHRDSDVDDLVDEPRLLSL